VLSLSFIAASRARSCTLHASKNHKQIIIKYTPWQHGTTAAHGVTGVGFSTKEPNFVQKKRWPTACSRRRFVPGFLSAKIRFDGAARGA
jgi:hypothetical protein